MLITSIDRTNYQRVYLDEGKQSVRRDERYSFVCALQWGFHTFHLCLWNLLPDKLLSIELDFRVWSST